MRKAILLAVSTLTMAGLAVAVQAGSDHHRKPVVKIKRLTVKNDIRFVDRRTVFRRAATVRNTGTYSGSIANYRIDGIGTWTYGTVSAPAAVVDIRPTAKIIDVDALPANAHCSMEAGVCVIRP